MKKTLLKLEDTHQISLNWLWRAWIPLSGILFLIALNAQLNSGIINSEIQLQSILKKNTTVAIEDPSLRTGYTQYFSKSNFVDDLDHLSPDIGMIFNGEATLRFNNTQEKIGRRVNILFVNSGAFDYLKYELLEGSKIDSFEFNNKAPVALLTPYLARQIFGDVKRSVDQRFTLNDTRFESVGVVKFSPDNLEENNTIIIPLGFANLLTQSNVISMKSFLLPFSGTQGLEYFQEKVDQLHLMKNYPPVHLKLILNPMKVSSRHSYLWGHRNVILNIVTNLMVAIGFLIVFFQVYRFSNSYRMLITWRKMLGKTTLKIWLEFVDIFCRGYARWVLYSLILNVIFTTFWKYALKVPLNVNSFVNIPFIILIVGVPLTFALGLALELNQKITKKIY
jgi:hypothetical protein